MLVLSPRADSLRDVVDNESASTNLNGTVRLPSSGLGRGIVSTGGSGGGRGGVGGSTLVVDDWELSGSFTMAADDWDLSGGLLVLLPFEPTAVFTTKSPTEPKLMMEGRLEGGATLL